MHMSKVGMIYQLYSRQISFPGWKNLNRSYRHKVLQHTYGNHRWRSRHLFHKSRQTGHSRQFRVELKGHKRGVWMSRNIQDRLKHRNGKIRTKVRLWTHKRRASQGVSVMCTLEKKDHDMKTSSNGNIFRITGPLWGDPPVTGGFSSQRPVMRCFDVFFDPRLNKRLSKQTRRPWFETPSRQLWRHCYDVTGTRCATLGNVWRNQNVFFTSKRRIDVKFTF